MKFKWTQYRNSRCGESERRLGPDPGDKVADCAAPAQRDPSRSGFRGASLGNEVESRAKQRVADVGRAEAVREGDVAARVMRGMGLGRDHSRKRQPQAARGAPVSRLAQRERKVVARVLIEAAEGARRDD